jgi:outer membrane protein TolC
MGRTARIQQARIDFQRAELGEATTKNTLELNYLQAKSNFANAYESYTTSKRNLELSKKIKTKTQVKFKEGISSSFDLTQSEEQYLQSQFSYLQSIIAVVENKEEFRKILSSKNN